MRIEILVGNSEEPLIYPLNKPKIVLGSAETCDVIIDGTKVSRKHLIILSEGDNYYVIDQGSTNGSFINEERLVPGRRTEFTSFFPVRLGDSILITLLSDEEQLTEESSLEIPALNLNEQSASPKGRGAEETTKMISLSDFQKAKTSDLVKRRETIAKKKAPEKTGKPTVKSKRIQEKKQWQKIKFIVVGLVGIAAYINFYHVERGPVENAKIGEEIPLEKPVEVKKVEAPKPTYLIPETDIVSKERLGNLLTDIKCTLDTEKYFCGKIYKANEGQFGSVQIGSMVNVLTDGQFFYDEAKRLLPIPPSKSPDGVHTKEEIDQHEIYVSEVMSVIFILRAIPNDIDYELIKDLKLTFGLFRQDPEGNWKIHTAIAILPSGIKEFKRIFEETQLQNIPKIGLPAIQFVKALYRVY